MLSLFLFYFIILLFLFFTYKNKKPIRWNELLHAITFNQYTRGDDTFRIPGPIRLPFIGTKWNCLFIKMNQLHEYYADLSKTYGNVVMELAGSVPVISLFNKQDIDKVLKYPSKYPFRPPTEIVEYYRKTRPDRYNSVGLVNTQGPEWLKLRSQLTPKTLESRKVLAEFCPELNEICDDFIQLVKQRRNEENIVEGVEEALKLLSFESACCLILGRRMDFLNDSTQKSQNFQDLISSAKNIFKCFRDSYFGNGLWKYFPSKTYNTYVENEERLYDIVLQIINKTLKNDDMMGNQSGKISILVTILKAEGLDNRDKISGVIDFIMAGIEVFSHTVSFLLYYLTINPETIEKIYQETQDMDDVLTQEDLSRAFYTRAAIHEAFRLSPSAFAIARILEEDFYLSGYHLKAGTVVLCQNMIAGRNNDYFENASEFIPERWLTESGEFNLNQCLGSSIILPFGCGKRICPGKKYTELELMILVIKLVKNFKIKYKSEFGQQFEFVLAAKVPVNVQFCDR